MSPELDDLLCKRYPAIFANRRRSMTCPMYWGFCCDHGWFDLIDGLCAKLQASADAGVIPQPAADQVKQKFGELRVSPRSGPLARALIEAAREQSAVTCEFCGAPGVLRSQNGVKTVCDLYADPDSHIVTPEERRS